MNITFWVLQVLLALHTVMGAVWKLSNSEQKVPSLSAIPHGAWLGLSGAEVLCSLALVLPALVKPLGLATPIAAAVIAGEMLLFSAIHLVSGDPAHGQMIYWLVVAAVCAFVAYGRFAMKPL
ncbi:MAG: DoxX family protein [Myxococcota bacterium]